MFGPLTGQGVEGPDMLIRMFLTAAFAAIAFSAQAQSRAPNLPPPVQENSYGPRVVTENGFTVHVPRNCYVSREQVRQGGQLIWRPVVTCPYDDYR